MSIEKRMAERRQQKAAEQKKKAQGRNAFKQQLEANAPKGEKGSKPKFMTNADSNINKLLLWTQRRTSVYPGVNVTDFGFSWSDGLAFCALLHSLCPNDFPLDQMREDDKRKNLTVAFKFASEQGVPALLDVEEMMSTETPDSKSIITYVHCIYKALVHDRKLSTTVIGSISSTGSTTSTSSISEE